MRIDLPDHLRAPALLAELFGAIFVMNGEPPQEISGLCIDTRLLRKGDLFLALRGEKSDGCAYLQDALKKGASALLIPDGCALPEGNYWAFFCENCENSLLLAAKKRRDSERARVVAVTGSAGKTTAKEAIAAVLGDVPCNEGNYNSTVGMPLSLLGFPRADAWVCELGINHVGEMARMTRALSPDVALITNVGDAHIGHFGDYSTLLSQKLSVSEGIREGGFLLVPKSLESFCAGSESYRMLTFGEGADFSVENIFMDQNGVRCDFRTPDRVITNLAWPIAGQIGLGVICAIGAVGALFGRSDQQIRSGLLRAGKRASRMRVYREKGYLLLEDCYNASPQAVLAAFESLCYLAEGRVPVAVLGDMLELGAHSRALHYALGMQLAERGLCALFTVGCAAYEIARGAIDGGMPTARVHCFAAEETDEVAADVLHVVPPNAAILLKASHAMHLERVSEQVRRML